MQHCATSCAHTHLQTISIVVTAELDDATKLSVVAAVIDVLELGDVAHSMIGDEETRGISGGQRKRVNIGIELVAYPTVLCLDEPTRLLRGVGG